MVKKCSTCGKEARLKYSEFNCPSCGQERIVRCESCRTLAARYTCGRCGFSGP